MKLTKKNPVLDKLSEGIILIDEGRVLSLNLAAAEFLDVDKAEAIGRRFIEVFRDHRLEQCYLNQEEMEINTRGRQLMAIAIEDGLILRDISEIRDAQNNARDLLSVLSHELRTPVTGIKTTLEALDYSLPIEQQQYFLKLMKLETQRLARLLEDLTVSVCPPVFRSLYLLELVSRAKEILKDRLKEHDIKLELNFAKTTIWADEDKILQILINLIENAAVHGPDHETVTIKTSIDSKKPDYLRILVQDGGEQLDIDEYEQLFSPHVSQKTVKGTGLGLYIVRSIAQRWQGETWAKAITNGNEFGFSVPLKKPELSIQDLKLLT